MRIALLSYSTKPRGGVVHTLALAEALAATGQDVTVWSLGRGGDTAFFRPVDPRVRLSVVPFPELPGERRRRADPALHRRTARRLRPIAVYDIVHAQDCISANAAGRCVRTVHHLDHFTTPELAACHERAIVEPYAHVCVSAAVADELAAGWGINGNGHPERRRRRRFAAAASGADRCGWRAGGHAARPLRPHASAASNPARVRWICSRPMPCSRATRPAAGDRGRRDPLRLPRLPRPLGEARGRPRRRRPIVLGPVDDAALPSLVAAAEVFAFPSVKEGFGLAPWRRSPPAYRWSSRTSPSSARSSAPPRRTPPPRRTSRGSCSTLPDRPTAAAPSPPATPGRPRQSPTWSSTRNFKDL